MVNIILSSVFPVALVILMGYIANKTLKLDQSTLSQISVYILAPAIVIDSFYRTNMSIEEAIRLLLGYVLSTSIIYGLVLIVSNFFKLSTDDDKGLFAISLCPNNGNMGLSIIAFSLGEEGLERAVMYMIFSSIVLFGILPVMLKGDNLIVTLKSLWKLPLIWSMFIGIFLYFTNITMPFNIGKSVEWLGISSIPIALIILGIQLSKTKFEFGMTEFYATIGRLAIAPLIAYGIGIMVGLEGLDLKVLTLQTAMPTAVNAVIMVKEFGGNTTMVARTIIISTLLSFATLPFIIWLLT
ncbi:AEC family transporter [Geminocystis herdmanii]|uniref:AEC family transporter n=1 Tax=Geminocystis herdmanii TaxID=669359 RepID=UPI00034552C0|nr:AEC family transporter [Geminocystis herdmanii]